jgi:hypothetical protein
MESKSVDEIEQYLTLDYRIIQTIVGQINEIISNIDEVIKPYRVKISEKGSFLLHRFA